VVDDQRIAWLRHLVSGSGMQDPGSPRPRSKRTVPEEVRPSRRAGAVVLPRDATPIDFAYAIHSDIGLLCQRRVNGRIATLRYTLRNGYMWRSRRAQSPSQ
jgi:GTP pyrophosphokinase